MHRLHIALLLLFLTATVAAAQPQATWLERLHDFGVFMEKDGKVTCRLRVVNTGTEPLLIVKAQAGCGCTGIDFPQDEIQPGDTAAVSLTYNPSGRPGQFTKQAIIFTNTIPRRTILEITGNVIPTDATLNKQYPVKAGNLYISQQDMPFGELTKGQNKTLFLSAYNASTDTLHVTVEGRSAHIKPTVVPDTVLPGHVTALTVHYLSGKAPLWGLNVDTLTLSCEALGPAASASTGSACINVMALVVESFDGLTAKQRSRAPVVSVDCGDRLDYGTLGEQDVVTRHFTVSNKGKDLLHIRRLWVPDGEGISIKADKHELKGGKTATVTVTVDASQLRDDLLNVPLTLMTNDPDSPRMTIRLVGIIDKK